MGMEIVAKNRVKIGKTQFKKSDNVSISDLIKAYTRTSIYRIDDGRKVGEAVCQVSVSNVEVDVRCSHFPEYYNHLVASNDCQKVEPNYFLVIKTGTIFKILYLTEDIDPAVHALGGMGTLGYGQFTIHGK